MKIKVTPPKWGFSRSKYFFDAEKKVIAKGLSSVKYMSKDTADELYELSKKKSYTRFIELLGDINKQTTVNTRQLELLIKLDFFSEFGNQRELLRIMDMFYNIFKRGAAKQMAKSKVDGTPYEPIFQKYAVGTTKSGGIAKNYILLDVTSIMYECEDLIKQVGFPDLEDIIKVQNFKDIMGYVGYVSNKEKDRPKLYVLDTYPLYRKKDGVQFGYSVITKSIGSGIETRFTVFNRLYNTEPIKEGNIILCKGYKRDDQYFTMTAYEKIS